MRELPVSSPAKRYHLVTLLPYVWSSALVAAVTSAIVLFHYQLNIESAALLYLLIVLLCAAGLGLGPAVLGAALSFVAFNFFFVPPLFTFAINDANDVGQFAMFVTAALIGGGLTVRAREQAATARRQAHEATALYDLSQAISAELDFRAIAPMILHTTVQLLACNACQLLLYDSDGSPQPLLQIGDWPDTSRSAEAALRSGEHVLGIIRIPLTPGQDALPRQRQQLLQNLATQTALALERSRLAQAVTQAAQLEESDRLKSTLLSAVSHDLRTPLATIVAAADDLTANDIQRTAATTRHLARLIRDEAERLNHLVTNMLDLSRIEAGVLQPQRGWYNIAEIVYRVVQRLASTLDGYDLQVNVPDDLPLVPVDYIQIEQVLWNVMENAAKYAPPHSHIAVTARQQDGAIQLRISDGGPGIPVDQHERVFDKFYRLSHGDHAQVAGAGLGLAISKGLVEAHGGQITLENNHEGGTVVIISLRLDT